MNFYHYLAKEHNYTDYQIKVVRYVLKSLFSEFTKFIIMGIFFFAFSYQLQYLWCMLIFALLRRYSGGLHCNTYLSCLLVTFLYMVSCIMILPLYTPPRLMQLALMVAAIVIMYKTAPVPSQYHAELSSQQTFRYRTFLLTIVFSYFIALFIIPSNQYILCGFWVIIIHSIQLLIAYIKEVYLCHS